MQTKYFIVKINGFVEIVIELHIWCNWKRMLTNGCKKPFSSNRLYDVGESEITSLNYV